MLLWHVCLQALLGGGQVVDKDSGTAHQLAVIVDDHWNLTARILCQVLHVLVLTQKDVNLSELIVNA